MDDGQVTEFFQLSSMITGEAHDSAWQKQDVLPLIGSSMLPGLLSDYILYNHISKTDDTGVISLLLNVLPEVELAEKTHGMTICRACVQDFRGQDLRG